jgi:hypothetical protein
MKENDTDTAHQHSTPPTKTTTTTHGDQDCPLALPCLALPNPTNTTVTREAQPTSPAKPFPLSLNTRLEPGCLLPLLRAKLARLDAFIYICLAVASSSPRCLLQCRTLRHDHTHFGLGPSLSFTTLFWQKLI